MKTNRNTGGIALQLEILANQIRHEPNPASQLLMLATARWLVEEATTLAGQPIPHLVEPGNRIAKLVKAFLDSPQPGVACAKPVCACARDGIHPRECMDAQKGMVDKAS